MSALGQRQTFAPQKPCPLYPRKPTFAVQLGMSALGQKRTWGGSFDHLVGGREQRSWHDKAESLGGFEVDRKLVFQRLLKR
jgi:hypothetical protein